MTPPLNLFIDLNTAGLDLDRADLEQLSQNLAQELQDGNLVEAAQLARESDLPDGAKSGAAAFLMGILTAQVNGENLKKLVDFLGNRFYGTKLTFSYERNGQKVSIDYRTSEELQQRLQTLEQVQAIFVQVEQGK